ncbi:MAG: diguanylate cyclase [Selenomonadaceae bacterium]|nr:diguanylate cyclase [Selenomonadaceae bacterium]
MKYSTKLLIANCIPILVFATISLIIGFMQFRANLYDEKQANLKSTALAAMALYSSHGYGDYGRKADGNIWRGMNFNVSEETSVVDDLKQQTNVDVTFFFGDAAAMTSIKNQDDVRAVDTNALDHIKNFTLAHGAQLWCRSIKINGRTCQAYVIPIRQESDNAVVGALMTSQSMSGFNRIIENYILTTAVTALVILFAAFLFIRWYVARFSQEFYDATNKSKHDLLTGLLNKRSFEDEVKAAIANKKPTDVSVLLILDFDNFKHVNDHYGHQIGDEVLKAFGLILERAFRTKDIIGRVGGDEFMVFMPDMTAEFLRRSEEISREILHELAVLKVGKAEHFSCSIGIGTDAGNYDFKKLYRLADKALYESKERGKACFVRFSSDEVHD